jgi:hypothetical protein
MLLSMMLILAITSALLELMIAAKIPAWRRLSAKSPLFNLLNSLFISFMVGIAFGASGLIAMGSGVISTLLTVPGYAFLKWNYDTPKAQELGGNQYVHYKAIAAKKATKTKEVAADVAKVGYVTARVITAPLWIPRDIKKKVVSYKNKSK